MKLGTLLLRNAAIGLSQLEAALRNQVLYGGRLGTNLVELGFIDLELLSTYLAEMSGFPVATAAVLDAADPALLAKLTADDAHRLRAIPLRAASDHVAVALVDPTDVAAITELELRLGARVSPAVVPELRGLYYLEKLYGLPRRQRFIRTGNPAAVNVDGTEVNAAAPDERRRAQPPGGMALPPAFTLQPRARRASQVPAPITLPPTISHASAADRIDTATHRDHIAEAFLDFGTGRADAMAIFLIRDGNAIGWRGFSNKRAGVTLDQVSLPLGGASSLQAAHDAIAPFVGPPPDNARPVETALWTALGTDPLPPAVVIVPIAVKQRVVNLVYAHVEAGAPPAAFVDELADLATRAQGAYLRLIRQARGA